MTSHLVVISGPSGVGKHTVINRLKDYLCFDLVVSYTTRQPRTGERDGVDYNFVSREEFIRLIADGALLEYNEYAGQYYGTPLQPVADGYEGLMLLEIEVNGARRAKLAHPGATLIFLDANLRELEERLRRRGTEDEMVIARRLETAKEERYHSRWFDHVVINDDYDRAAHEISLLLSSKLN